MNSLAIHFPASGTRARSQADRRSPGGLALFTLSFCTYFVGSLVGFALQLPSSVHSHQISVFWPPNAILLSLLLVYPAARWPVILLGALPAHILIQAAYITPAWLIEMRFVNNCIVAALAAVAVKGISGQKRFSFDTLRTTIIFLVAGAGSCRRSRRSFRRR